MSLMSLDIRLPFYIVGAAAKFGVLALALTWRAPSIRRLTERPGAT